MLYDPKWETEVPAADTKQDDWRIILRKAAQLLKERGWIQKKMQDEAGRMCMLGAVIAASDELRAKGSAVAGERLEKLMLETRLSVPSWNDVMGRTKEEVIEKLLEAANQ